MSKSIAGDLSSCGATLIRNFYRTHPKIPGPRELDDITDLIFDFYAKVVPIALRWGDEQTNE